MLHARVPASAVIVESALIANPPRPAGPVAAASTLWTAATDRTWSEFKAEHLGAQMGCASLLEFRYDASDMPKTMVPVIMHNDLASYYPGVIGRPQPLLSGMGHAGWWRQVGSHLATTSRAVGGRIRFLFKGNPVVVDHWFYAMEPEASTPANTPVAFAGTFHHRRRVIMFHELYHPRAFASPARAAAM